MKSKESRPRSGKEVEFNAAALLRSLRGHADHLAGRKKVTLHVTSLVLPARVRSIKSREVAGIRHKLNVSQAVFAALLNVPLTTAQSWEQGRRKPSGAALRLLGLAREHPKLLLAA